MPLLPLRRSILPDSDAILPYLKEIDANRWYSNRGPLLHRFEELLADHFGVHSEELVTVSNATLGLQLALVSATKKYGHPFGVTFDCIMPGFTFAASAVAANGAGGRAVFADIDTSDWTLSPESAKSRMEGGRLSCAMPISVFGAPVSPEPWEAFQRETGCPVVIDAAWCFDSIVPSSIPTVVSLHATKVFGIGEGGVVICRDRSLIAQIRRLSNFGFDENRVVSESGGTNAKLSEFSAAVGLAAFDRWPDTRARAIALAQTYRASLGEFLHPEFSGEWAPGAVALLFSGAELADRAETLFDASDIQSRRWWSPLVNEMPAFCGVEQFLPISTDMVKRVLNVPFHEEVRAIDVERIAEIVDDIHR